MVFVVIIILVFLFICFIWGIGSVVGGIKDATQSNRSAQSPVDRQADVHPTPPIPQSQPTPKPAVTLAAAKSQPPGEVAAEFNGDSTTLDAALNRLQVIGTLHRDGTLSHEEFALIKAKLIKDIQRA